MKCQDCMYLTNDSCLLNHCLYKPEKKSLIECTRKVYEHFVKNDYMVFDANAFEPIKNGERGPLSLVKPQGGLWASPVESRLNWKTWCENEKMDEWIQNGSFKFTLNHYAEILEIRSVKDLIGLPMTFLSRDDTFYLDFERLAKKYDAMEVYMTEDPKLYWALYGWDCDSILVMNPDVIDIL